MLVEKTGNSVEGQEQETWKPIPMYKGWYSASNFGRIRRDKKGKGTYPGRILRIKAHDISGHLCLSLSNGSEKNRKRFHLHVLIARTFIGKRQKGLVCNHKDGIKINNIPNNLEYITQGENIKHAFKIGLMPVGEKHYRAKHSNKQILQIMKEYKEGTASQRAIGRKYGISSSIINRIINRKIWRYL